MRLAGLDTDTFGVYVVTVPLEGEILPETIGWEQIELRPRTTTKGRSISSTFDAAAGAWAKLADSALLPSSSVRVAYIEHGYGASKRNDYEQGRVQGAVAAWLSYGSVIAINEVNASTWKKDVIGNGNAKKDQVRETLAARGFFLPSQHLYDALGVALYGRLINDKIAA